MEARLLADRASLRPRCLLLSWTPRGWLSGSLCCFKELRLRTPAAAAPQREAAPSVLGTWVLTAAFMKWRGRVTKVAGWPSCPYRKEGRSLSNLWGECGETWHRWVQRCLSPRGLAWHPPLRVSWRKSESLGQHSCPIPCFVSLSWVRGASSGTPSHSPLLPPTWGGAWRCSDGYGPRPGLSAGGGTQGGVHPPGCLYTASQRLPVSLHPASVPKQGGPGSSGTLSFPFQWSCCGARGPNDWNLNIYFNCTDLNPSRERCGVPFSCCVRDPAVSGAAHGVEGTGSAQAASGKNDHRARLVLPWGRGWQDEVISHGIPLLGWGVCVRG